MEETQAPKQEDPSAAGVERRQHERRGVRVNRLIRPLIDDGNGSPHEEYIYLVDMSEGGLRANLDREFPGDRAVRMQFTLQYLELDVSVRVVWQKSLAGGTWTVGLAFENLDSGAAVQVKKMVEAFSVQGRRDRFRLKSLVSVSVRRADDPVWVSVLLVDVSSAGLRVRCNEVYDVDSDLDVRLFPPDHDEVSGRASVIWCQEAGPMRWEYGLRFLALEGNGAAILQSYIDQTVGAV